MTENHEIASIEMATLPGYLLPRPGQWIGAMLVALSACASVPEHSAAPVDKQQLVARMAQSRWDALLKKDFAAAYNLVSPASRTVVTLQDFQRKSSMVTWKAASVRKVECSADDLCAVQMDVKYVYRLRIGNGKDVEGSQILAETWRNTAGDWWYVPANAL
jgi:hypothetical protein